ncbi:MAG: universal stress protein [Ideonella sp.]|nr:universal stress protein [Ideonella sp.]
MAYHTTLVHLDNEPACAVRTGIALRLAREHGSHLIGLAPTGQVQIPVDVASTLFEPGYAIASGHYLRTRADKACEEFDARARAAGLSSFETRVDEADHAESVIAHARGADLVIVGQTDRDAPLGVVNRDLPERVALGGGRPVLIVPYAGRFETLGSTVLAAWNNSREAARALADALPILQRANRVIVLTQRGAQEPEPSLAALQSWLARHSVQCEAAHEVSNIDFGDLLLSRAADLGADLIVMGSYGRARLTERVLGGATRSLLEQMTVPVLMAH